MNKRQKKELAPILAIVFSFLAVIFIGTFLLTLPISSKSRNWTDVIDALFTATSAACVTGLSPFNTGLYWSLFGKCVIIVLIQIGGLGAMSIIMGLVALVRKRTSLQNTRILIQSAGNDSYEGIRPLVRRMFLGTILCEALGAGFLAIRFIPKYGAVRGIFYSIFHAVSAFCNAGFDILGGNSLCEYALDPLVNITLIALIIVGGLGFIVWDDLIRCRFRFRRLRFHSKIVIVTNTALLIVSFIAYFGLEYNHAFAGYTLGGKLLLAAFQAVSPRTAGFASFDLTTLSDGGALFTMAIMLIGGSPGSTAGGVKTTTFAVMLISAWSSALNASPTFFKRKIDNETVRQAGAVMTVYILAILIGTITLCAVEALPLKEAMFEVVSAIGTVGVSMNVTSGLGAVGKILITILMFAGRIGGLSIVVALSASRKKRLVEYPKGKIIVG